MRFATFVLFASTFASSLAVPAPQPMSTVTVGDVFAKTSDVVSGLVSLRGVAAQISTNTTISSSTANTVIQNVNLVLHHLVLATAHNQRDLIGGLLGGLLGGGGSQCGILQIASGDDSLLDGLLGSDPLGDLLCNGGGILSGLLGDDGLLGGLLDPNGLGGLLGGLLGGGDGSGSGGGLLGGLLGGGDGGGLLGGLLGGGGDGSDGGNGGLGGLLGGLLGGGALLGPIGGLLGGSSDLGSACGIPTVSLVVNILQGLVVDLNGLLSLGSQCTPCGSDSEFDALFGGLMRDNAAKLAAVSLRSH
ncbi:hypothetical protein FB45DRAFT_1131644 [Roridomyces roridus]|uniref:Uncharacterized protein n=1 Tax=Roridomyces roridus TaxID=1738132 RepID=A0AAD7C3I2_9AGAR|nr:hypothetical protein FB45DRAFT_1131644 [Roridomyces roridus]